MEANYQNTDKQKFKAPFDVEESSEENVCRGHGGQSGDQGETIEEDQPGHATCWGLPSLGSCPVLPSCAVRLKPNKTVFHLSNKTLSIGIQAW